MILLSVAFITCIPNTLIAGNKIGTIKNAFSEVVRLKFGREKTVFLFIRYAARISAVAARLNPISSETVDNGVS